MFSFLVVTQIYVEIVTGILLWEHKLSNMSNRKKRLHANNSMNRKHNHSFTNMYKHLIIIILFANSI